MLITRRSRRTRQGDHPFRPRFDGDSDAFILRQYLRCREEIVRLGITLVLQAGLLVAFALFARTMHQLFQVHGQRLAGWVEPAVLGFIAVAILLAARRLWRLIGELREARQDLRRYRRELSNLKLPS